MQSIDNRSRHRQVGLLRHDVVAALLPDHSTQKVIWFARISLAYKSACTL